MRFLRYLVLAVIALFLVALALSNREPVTLRLLSDELAAQIGLPAVLNAVTLPLFGVIAAGIGIGILLGFVAEWLREHKFRAEAREKRREAALLSSELKKAKIEKAQGDDVLALLDEAEGSR
jgi:uncharacterized integral membrane protein